MDELTTEDIVEMNDENGRNALIWSAMTSDCPEATEAGVKILEKAQGQGLDRRDNFGSTAIMFAAQGRRKALVEAMLNFNPDLTSKNRRDKTALDYAKGDDDISSLIRERGGPSTHSRVSIQGDFLFTFGWCIVPSYVSPARPLSSFPIMHRVPYQAVSPGCQ